MDIVKAFNLIRKNRLFQISFAVSLIAAAALVFALRYTPAFTTPNFYAEDGHVFTNNVLHKNVIASNLTGFNGYLIVGLYLLLDAAVVVYKVFGLHFYQLPVVIAALSCLFLGLTASLPYLLFRKRLGAIPALLAVVFGTFVAIPSFDYAIIGTIGNLKFLFLYWAFLFCIYRNLHANDARRVVASDVVLLLCVLTYAPAVFLLPVALLPYKAKIMLAIKSRSIKSLQVIPVISIVLLCLISFLYLVVVYLKGIPKIPGYLDTPYAYHATPKLLYRVTWYQWLFPISSVMRDLVSVGLVALTAYVGLLRKKNWFVVIFGGWAILVATASFVANRPGISSYFLTYGPNPDQFFYAQTLIFMFICIWIASYYYHQLKLLNKAVVLFAAFLFMWWAFPAASSYGKNKIIYANLNTAKVELREVCKLPNRDITFQNYPTADWKWTISKSIACK